MVEWQKASQEKKSPFFIFFCHTFSVTFFCFFVFKFSLLKENSLKKLRRSGSAPTLFVLVLDRNLHKNIRYKREKKEIDLRIVPT